MFYHTITRRKHGTRRSTYSHMGHLLFLLDCFDESFEMIRAEQRQCPKKDGKRREYFHILVRGARLELKGIRHACKKLTPKE